MKTVDNEHLDTLPNGAVIKTGHGIYMRNKPRLFPDEWCWIKQGNMDTYPRLHLRRPAEVLYNPDAADEEEIADTALQATMEEVRAATNRVAAAIFEQVEPDLDWNNPPSEAHRELYREVARAAIQAFVSGDEDQLRRIPSYPSCPTCDGGGCGDCV